MDSAWLRIAQQTLEEWHDSTKPYFPAVSRWLITSTFYEDAFRILLQWSEQQSYLESHSHLPSIVVSFYLLTSILCMQVCSTLIIAQRFVPISVVILTAVLLSQTVLYGLIFDMVFFLRTISMSGALLLCLSESLLKNEASSKSMFGLPQLSESETHQYLQFIGRVLIVILFVSFIFNGEWGALRVILSFAGLTACTTVVLGFQTRLSAMFLFFLLCLLNILANNWWWSAKYSSSQQHDLAKYDFFQTLSVVGGLLLLASIGPGKLSYDERKKDE